jgi:tripartite-type tricarboxylate transporter receptor subunit TctC
MRKRIGALVAILGLAWSWSAQAQTFPSRTVRIIVPQAPGGATDIVARAVGQRLSAAWGQPVVIENKVGANNLVAAEHVARAEPDGHTLFASPEATFVINPYIFRKLPYDAETDFVPVSGLALINQILVVNPSVPARSVGELIALARAKPGELSVGTLATGSAAQLNVELFQAMAGVKLAVVNYRGGAPTLTDVVAGHVNMTILSVALTAEHIRAGKVRALGIGSTARTPAFPDLPTISESGVPGYEAAAWFGLFARAGTPPETVRKINADVQRVLQDPDFQDKFLRPNYVEPILGSVDAFAAFVKGGAAKWSKLIKDANIKVD